MLAILMAKSMAFVKGFLSFIPLTSHTMKCLLLTTNRVAAYYEPLQLLPTPRIVNNQHLWYIIIFLTFSSGNLIFIQSIAMEHDHFQQVNHPGGYGPHKVGKWPTPHDHGFPSIHRIRNPNRQLVDDFSRKKSNCLQRFIGIPLVTSWCRWTTVGKSTISPWASIAMWKMMSNHPIIIFHSHVKNYARLFHSYGLYSIQGGAP